ncbi:MAG: aminomethyl-transferring glycine dehydrogenase subunit GcvPA [Candidatus Altiarchaeota archaeon]|nr:aminomethyl-transferring glycine dehydrogenase subunit GcvPA [Candidatus Altiarchaeota archaeon]
MRYTPSSQDERHQMLEFLGLKETDDLYSDLPEEVLLCNSLKIGNGMSEQELASHIKSVASQNKIKTSFLGAGYYRHYIPSAVNHITLRSEFYTAYTPYQAEVSQGVLQALFEYQSTICELTGQEVSNASMYDGSTALAEACVMAHRITKRDEILVSETLHPHYLRVLKTYCNAGDLKLSIVGSEDGTSENIMASDKTAAVVVQTPNFFGVIEESDTIFEMAKKKGAVSIACTTEATSLGLIEPAHADITCGEGQALGNPVSFGGPAFGFLATKMEYVRQMPGRLVGETVDSDGKRAYALTLQAREQHIRREKATSNICTSQSLCAIAATAYLALIGPKGFRNTALNSHKNAVYLCEKISEIDGFERVFDKPFYNEFLLKCPKGTYDKIIKAGFEPGYDVSKDRVNLGGCMLFASTELHTKDELDTLVEALK